MPRLTVFSIPISFAVFMSLLLAFSLPGSAQTPRRVALIDEGNEAWRVGDIVTATHLWDESIRLSRFEGDGSTELDALARRGEALSAAGQLTEAADDLRAALEIARRLPRPVTVAALEGALGNLSLQSHDLEHATTWLCQSIEDARNAGDNGVIATSENNLGNVAAARGETNEAMGEFCRSIEDARSAGVVASGREPSEPIDNYKAASKHAVGDKQLQATIAINMARAWLQQSRSPGADSRRLLAKADASLSYATKLVRTFSPASRDQVVALMAIIQIGLSTRKSESSGLQVADLTSLEQLSQQAFAISSELRDMREESLTAGTMAEVLDEAGRLDEAARWDHNAIRDGISVDAKDLLWRWEWLNGRLAKKVGDLARARDAYRRAWETLEDIRTDVPVIYNQGRSSFREELGPLYFEFVDLLLAEADTNTDQQDAKRSLEESVHVIEQFETAEVLNFFHRPCGRISDSPPDQPRPRTNEATLYPILRPDHIDLLLSLPDGTLIHRTTKIGQTQSERTVQRFRAALKSPHGDRRLARQLYEWLVQPIREDLSKDIDTLVVVPDGILRNIPFSALYDSRSRQYLVEQLAVVTEPSAYLAFRPNEPPPTRERVLLAGASTYTESGASPLPGVTDELAAIAKLKPGATVLENGDFTAEAMRQKLKGAPFTTVHVAAHAVFLGSPETSFIQTAKGQFSMDMLDASVKSSEFQDDPIVLDLLVLSACETASGNDQSALGLAGVAVQAGARSAIGSLWEVSDPVAVELMPDFYKNLENRPTTKAKALQQAQIDVLRHTKYTNPYFWAPFLMIGSGV